MVSGERIPGMAEIRSTARAVIKEFLWFLWSVVKQWKLLVTGAGFTLLIGVGEHALQRSITIGQYLGILALLVFLACFLAWREERRSAEAQRNEAESLKIRISELDKPDLHCGFTSVMFGVDSGEKR